MVVSKRCGPLTYPVLPHPVKVMNFFGVMESSKYLEGFSVLARIVPLIYCDAMLFYYRYGTSNQ